MSNQRGFSIIELIITLVIVALLAAVAVPAYGRFVDKARTSKAVGDIASLNIEIEQFRLRNNDRIPASLAELDIDIPLDPWEQEYRYLRLQGPSTIGSARKNGQLVPLNSDYDLYSIGADGNTATPLSAAQSRDDIVRANDGTFIGRAEDY